MQAIPPPRTAVPTRNSQYPGNAIIPKTANPIAIRMPCNPGSERLNRIGPGCGGTTTRGACFSYWPIVPPFPRKSYKMT